MLNTKSTAKFIKDKPGLDKRYAALNSKKVNRIKMVF